MDTVSATELDSLRRRAKSFSDQLFAHDQQHRETIGRLNESMSKRNKSHDRISKELHALKVERNKLKRCVSIWESKFKAKELECAQFEREVRTLCGKCDAVGARLKELENTLTHKQSRARTPQALTWSSEECDVCRDW